MERRCHQSDELHQSGPAKEKEKVLGLTGSTDEGKPGDGMTDFGVQSHISEKNGKKEKAPQFLTSFHVLTDNRENGVENEDEMKDMLSSLGISQEALKSGESKQAETGHEGSSDEEMTQLRSSNCLSELGVKNRRKDSIKKLQKKIRNICDENTELNKTNTKLRGQLERILVENHLLGLRILAAMPQGSVIPDLGKSANLPGTNVLSTNMQLDNDTEPHRDARGTADHVADVNSFSFAAISSPTASVHELTAQIAQNNHDSSSLAHSKHISSMVDCCSNTSAVQSICNPEQQR